MVNLDKSVGLIIKELKEKGLYDHTIIVFTSDNGVHSEGGHDPSYFDSNGPFRGQKRDLYEGGIRSLAGSYSTRLIFLHFGIFCLL